MTFTDARADDHALALVRLGPKLREEAGRLTGDPLQAHQLVHDTLVDALGDQAPVDARGLASRLRRRAGLDG